MPPTLFRVREWQRSNKQCKTQKIFSRVRRNNPSERFRAAQQRSAERGGASSPRVTRRRDRLFSIPSVLNTGRGYAITYKAKTDANGKTRWVNANK